MYCEEDGLEVEITWVVEVLSWLETDRVIRWGKGVGTELTVTGGGGTGDVGGMGGGRSVVGAEPAVTEGGEIWSEREVLGRGKEEEEEETME